MGVFLQQSLLYALWLAKVYDFEGVLYPDIGSLKRENESNFIMFLLYSDIL